MPDQPPPEIQSNFFSVAREIDRLLSPATEVYFAVGMCRAVREGRPPELIELVQGTDPLFFSDGTYRKIMYGMLTFNGAEHAAWAFDMLAAKGGFHHTYTTGLQRLERITGEDNVFTRIEGKYAVLCAIASEAARCAPFRVPGERQRNEHRLG